MQLDEEQETTSTPTYSWAEAWSIIGAAPDEMLSLTQAKLLTDAYDIEKTPKDAVADGELTEVHKRGIEHDDRTMQIHAGYRLIGDPEEVETQ